MILNKCLVAVLALALCSGAAYGHKPADMGRKDREIPQQQWTGKKVAFLGDSITDREHIGTEKNYWQFLEEMLGIEALVYGINGHQWSDLPEQAEKLKEEEGDRVDAIIIFAGTNDYYADVTLGEW